MRYVKRVLINIAKICKSLLLYFYLILSRRTVWLVILGFLCFVYLIIALLSQKCHAKYEMPPYLLEDAKCDDELMAMPFFLNGTRLGFGRRFGCSLLPDLSRFHLLVGQMNVTPRAFKDSEVVFVTYASSNHLGETRLSIQALRESGFQNKIVFYDLGIANSARRELSSVCNLEVRTFNFSAYPSFVKNLHTYTFKALIIAEMFQELDAFWFFDASVRFVDRKGMGQFLDRVRNGHTESYVLRMPARHSIYASTDSGMYAYFPIDRKSYKSFEMLESGTTFVWKTEFSRDAIKWFVLCTLTEDCITPPGSKHYCNYDRGRFDVYLDCHRYDQSAINLILNNLLEQRRQPRARRAEGFSFVNVKRWKNSYSGLDLPCKSEDQIN